MDFKQALDEVDRRPIHTRSALWAQGLASQLIAWKLTPNAVSLLSILFALLGGLSLFYAREWETSIWLYLIAVGAIQLRLLCNMLDGLMAVEGKMQSKTGVLFNEIPDRVADTLFLVGAGYASASSLGISLGWLAAVLALGTAYLRALGAGCGFKQDFCGPMAKPHRMFILTLALSFAVIEVLYQWPARSIFVGLVLIVVGSALTCGRRMIRLGRRLNQAL